MTGGRYLGEGQLAGQSDPLLGQKLLLIFIEDQLLDGLLRRLRRLQVRQEC